MTNDQEKLHQRIQSLAGTVQGHEVKFDGIHWTCTVGVEMQIDTPDGEVYELHEAEFSGRLDDDRSECLAEVWDWVAEEYTTWTFEHPQGVHFGALHTARRQLRDAGYVVGFISEHGPAAIVHGSRKLGQWEMLSPKQRAGVHGVLWFGNGHRMQADVHVTLFPDVDPGPGLGSDQ